MTHFMTPIVKKFFLANVIIYLLHHWLDIALIDDFGLRSFLSEAFFPYQLFTHLFVHANFFHLLSNMLVLYMLGPILEKTLGEKRFFIFFFFTGIGASLIYLGINYLELKKLKQAYQNYILHTTPENFYAFISEYSQTSYRNYYHFVQKFFNHPQDIDCIKKSASIVENLFHTKIDRPIVGASGAVFGLLMAFAMLFPNASLFLIFIPIPIKAKYFVALYGIYELYAGIQDHPTDQVAHFAHLGGILFAYIFIRWLRKN